MKKFYSRFFILTFAILMILIPIKSKAATFNENVDEHNSVYIVPYGREIGVNYEENETLTSSNENICKVEAAGKLQIVGVGKFTLISKKGEEEKQLDFFAWNVCLKKDGYTVFSDVNKTKSAGDVYGKTYFAISKTSVEKSFKIEEHLFITGRYTGKDLNGKYLTSHYNEINDSSDVNNFVYALDNKFDQDDDGTQGGNDPQEGDDEGTYDAKIKLGDTYTPKSEGSLTWVVENEDILTIEDAAKGKVRGIRVGTTTLTGKSGNTKKVELKIKVYREKGQLINVQRIVLDKTSVELSKSEVKTKPEKYKLTDKEKINATVEPSYADNRKVTWETSNRTVAKVSNQGRIKPVSAGEVVITASTDNKTTATCKVTIKDGTQGGTQGETPGETQGNKPVYNYSVSGKVIKSYKDSTINVSVELIDGFYVSKIWVKNPSTQVKKKQSSNTTLVRTRTVNEILNDTPKAIIGSNASSYSRSMAGNIDKPNGNIIITEGVIKRQWENKTADVILGMLKNGTFKYYRSSPYSDLINDGVKNTFKFGPILIENGKASSKSEPHQRPNQKAERTCIGQMDSNNYIILSTKGEEKTDAAQALGLKLGANFLYNADGGGSTTLWFREKTSGKGTQIKSSGRKLPDTLYFVTEAY